MKTRRRYVSGVTGRHDDKKPNTLVTLAHFPNSLKLFVDINAVYMRRKKCLTHDGEI